jgi:Cd2+/Zn2+-exporting ATPase
MISALSAAARHGVLIKGGAYLEALSRIQAVAFDKTGTLTSGQPTVVAIRAATCIEPIMTTRGNCEACNDVLALAYAVERRSEHPVAYAISSASTERGLEQRYPAAQEVTALVGRGVNGQVNGQAILIGSHRHFDAAIPHDPIHCAEARQEASQGYTPVLVSTNGTYLGTITIADTVRDTSREAVQQLKNLGLKAVVMLTGDTQQTAERIAADVGVTDVRAELLPEHKVAAVTALQQRYGPIAMVGDGINDTPALATASVGIAIGGAHGGSNQAMETADITLMSADLRQLPLAIRLSRAAMRTVATNITFSIGIKILFLVLVLFGAGTLWMAVLADVGAAVLVTLNGMRLLGYGRNSRQPSALII